MGHIKTGFMQIDDSIGGLERGHIYFLSAQKNDAGRGFSASLCASTNSICEQKAVLYTDSPIPYCLCEHVHFSDMEKAIEFFDQYLINAEVYELPKIDLFIVENYGFLYAGSIDRWPSPVSLKEHLYRSSLRALKNLAQDFHVTFLLTETYPEDADISNLTGFEFPHIRKDFSEGSFVLPSQNGDTLEVTYLDHKSFTSIPFKFQQRHKVIPGTYLSYQEFSAMEQNAENI